MRPVIALPVVIFVLAAGLGTARAEEPRSPRFDGITYGTPGSHLALSPHVGDAARLRSLAGQLRGDTEEATLAAIYQWMNRNFRRVPSNGATWRTLDQMMRDRTTSGPGDHATFLGTMARACGIPAVWVKTADLAWIREFREGRPAAREPRGQVFLEVHLGGRWQLLDPTTMQLWATYDPATRVLPGQRYAYDKGDDPHDLVLPNRRDAWLAQTHAYFGRLDGSQLPWGAPKDLLVPWRVFIAGKGPQARYAQTTCDRLGFHVVDAFDSGFERFVPRVRGRTLVVTCEGNRPVLPESEWARWLPSGYQDIVAGRGAPAEGYLSHRLRDGTQVILVPAQEYTALQVALARALATDR